jgi:hypothetical protein
VVVAVVLAAVVALLGLGTVRLDSGSEEGLSGGPSSGVTGEVRLDGPGLEWSPVDVPVQGELTVTFADGTYLAVEQLGGFEDRSRVQARVWVSPDGWEWQPLESDWFPAGTTLRDVTAYGGVVVAVGSSQDEGVGVVPRVWRWTTDSGWSEPQLLRPTLPSERAAFLVGVVAGPKGFVATGFPALTVDPSELIRQVLPPEVAAGLDAGASLGWGTGGVEVTGPGQITIFQASFDQLGLDKTLFLTEDGPPAEVHWWSPDGQNWELIEAQLPHFFGRVSVIATPDGFVAGGWPRWTSNNGTTWTPADTERADQPVVEVGRWRDRFVGLSSSQDQLWTSDDAVHWNPASPNPFFGSSSDYRQVTSLAAGDFGILALVGDFGAMSIGGGQTSTIEKDGLIVTFDGVGAGIIVRDGTSGEELLRVFSKGERTQRQVTYDFDTQTMTLADHETGQEVVTLTFEEIWAARDATYPTPEPKTQLLFTHDGQKWNRQATETQLGSGYPQSLAVGENQAVAVTTNPSGTSSLWVGTLHQ